MSSIYFATNRNQEGEGFGKNFSPNGLADLRFGVADVEGGKILSIQVAPDKPSEGSTAVYEAVKRKMAEEKRDTMIMIHGYATSFEQAILGAAKTKAAYGPANLNVFMFSWPSDGRNAPHDYGNDRHDAQASGLAFARGIMKLVEFLRSGPACGRRIHLLAHSMGNYVLRHTLQELIKMNPAGRLPRVFDNVFSMAADEDADALEHADKWARLPELTQALHIYFSRHDRALQGSDATKGNPDRMGNDGPARPLDIHSKVTLIDVSKTDRFLLDVVGHGYYDEKQAVIDDVLATLAGLEPDQIPGRRYVQAKNRYVIG